MILRIPAWFNVTCPLIIAVTAVTGRDVEIMVVTQPWTKSNPPAVMIRLRLIDREHCFDICRRRVRDIGIRRNLILTNLINAGIECSPGTVHFT